MGPQPVPYYLFLCAFSFMSVQFMYACFLSQSPLKIIKNTHNYISSGTANISQPLKQQFNIYIERKKTLNNVCTAHALT